MANTLKLGAGKWATGTDTVLAFNDENNNFKPLPFSFSRASSATVVNQSGLIETVGSGEPRIDFSNDAKGALLLEPQRSNLVIYSANGTYGNSPASEENTISPDGTNNAVIPTPDSTANRYQYTINGGTYSTNTKLAYSWYRKRISTPIDASYVGDIYFNAIQNATSVGSATQIQSDVNGFDRFEAVFNITDGSATTIIRGYFGLIIGVGNSSIAYWGHQLEVGSYATSYIPTSGSAVTRVADACSQTPPSGVIGQTEGTMYVEIREKTTPSIDLFECGQGSSQHRFLVYTDASSKLKVLVVNNYSVQVNYTSTVNVDSNAKIAIGYANNNYAIYLNGSLLVTDTIATVPPMNQIAIGSDRGAIVSKSNQIKEFKLYNTRLSNSELAVLTQ